MGAPAYLILGMGMIVGTMVSWFASEFQHRRWLRLALGVGRHWFIASAVPGVRKGIKWNPTFYGVERNGWFLDLHCFTTYVKVAFFHGTSSRPLTNRLDGPLCVDFRCRHRDIRRTLRINLRCWHDYTPLREQLPLPGGI